MIFQNCASIVLFSTSPDFNQQAKLITLGRLTQVGCVWNGISSLCWLLHSGL